MKAKRVLPSTAIVCGLVLGVASGCGGNQSSAPVVPTQLSANGQRAQIQRPNTFTVSILNDSGKGSLRNAIANVNKVPPGTGSFIRFTVSGTIRLASNLPAISSKVQLDGTTSPQYARTGPVVEIDANRRGGLVFAAGSGGSQLLGLSIVNARSNGVTLNAGSITVNGNYIGVTAAGTALGNGGDGLYVSAQSANNLIGYNPSAASNFVANVISGNAGNGLSFHGSTGNTVVDNHIGTDATGTTSMANGANGIWVTDGSASNVIGGTAFVNTSTGAVNNPTGNKGTVPAVFVVPPLGNLISGNAGNGVLIGGGSKNTMLFGNFIGTRSDGDAAIPNGGDGVRVYKADYTLLAGCKFVNNPFVYYNVVSGNRGNGIRVTDSNNVTIQGNFFGVGANNTATVANGKDGILVDGTSKTTVVGGVIPLGNVSAGNKRNGIEVADTASGFLTFNTFGGLLAFKGAAANGNDGLLITSTGGNQTVRTNVFSGNTKNGIEIAGDASGVMVDPNIAGLTTKGNAILSNGGDGIRVDGTAHNNSIGGSTPSVIPQNAFSGNAGYGIAIVDGAHDNTVINSDVGTNVTGEAAIANAKGGIYVGGHATYTTIGGTAKNPPRKNIVSGNTGNGITLDAASSYTKVIGNWIGLNRNGRKAIPNSGKPVVVSPTSTHNTIKGNITSP